MLICMQPMICDLVRRDEMEAYICLSFVLVGKRCGRQDCVLCGRQQVGHAQYQFQLHLHAYL